MLLAARTAFSNRQPQSADCNNQHQQQLTKPRPFILCQRWASLYRQHSLSLDATCGVHSRVARCLPLLMIQQLMPGPCAACCWEELRCRCWSWAKRLGCGLRSRRGQPKQLFLACSGSGLQQLLLPVASGQVWATGCQQICCYVRQIIKLVATCTQRSGVAAVLLRALKAPHMHAPGLGPCQHTPQA